MMKGSSKVENTVAKHVPEFAGLKVKSGGRLVAQNSPMTMAQLMSHSAGFLGDMIVKGATLFAGVRALANRSLSFQPVPGWRCRPGVEVQGYLMEKWAGKYPAAIFQERLAGPLGLKDTNFWVPPEKRARVVPSSMASPWSKPKRLIPSYGLHATAMDYWKIMQMVLNGRKFERKRYLKPETVKLMRKNVLQVDKGVYVKLTGGRKGVGFGLNFAVIADPAPTKNNMPKGSFFWGGAFGTWMWIDPTYNIVFVGLINAGLGLSGDSSLRQQSAKAIYSAIRR
jgi:CubicO group peptidase (beta-lactamase class C family)